MQQIDGLTTYPNQQLTLKLLDGSILKMTLIFLESQNGWFFKNLDWNNGQWIENGRRITTHPNMLRQYKNIIPFGLACYTINNREPTQQQDFTPTEVGGTAASSLFILTAQEVIDVDKAISVLKNA